MKNQIIDFFFCGDCLIEKKKTQTDKHLMGKFSGSFIKFYLNFIILLIYYKIIDLFCLYSN